MEKPPDAQNPRGTTPEGSGRSSSVSTRMVSNNDSRSVHLQEALIRLESVEAGLARVAIGLESTDTLPSYVRLIQVARWHLKAA